MEAKLWNKPLIWLDDVTALPTLLRQWEYSTVSEQKQIEATTAEINREHEGVESWEF